MRARSLLSAILRCNGVRRKQINGSTAYRMLAAGVIAWQGLFGRLLMLAYAFLVFHRVGEARYGDMERTHLLSAPTRT